MEKVSSAGFSDKVFLCSRELKMAQYFHLGRIGWKCMKRRQESTFEMYVQVEDILYNNDLIEGIFQIPNP